MICYHIAMLRKFAVLRVKACGSSSMFTTVNIPKFFVSGSFETCDCFTVLFLTLHVPDPWTHFGLRCDTIMIFIHPVLDLEWLQKQTNVADQTIFD
jgi:hypothetical protein